MAAEDSHFLTHKPSIWGPLPKLGQHFFCFFAFFPVVFATWLRQMSRQPCWGDPTERQNTSFSKNTPLFFILHKRMVCNRTPSYPAQGGRIKWRLLNKAVSERGHKSYLPSHLEGDNELAFSIQMGAFCNPVKNHVAHYKNIFWCFIFFFFCGLGFAMAPHTICENVNDEKVFWNAFLLFKCLKWFWLCLKKKRKKKDII